MVNDESAELDTAGGSSELGEENIFHGYVEVHTKQFKPSKKGPLGTLTWIRQSDALNFFWSGCLISLLATVQLTTVLVRPAQFFRSSAMSQAESSTNVADVAAASQPPVAVVAKPRASEVAVTSLTGADAITAASPQPECSSVPRISKSETAAEVVISTGPSVHPAIWGFGLLVFAALFFGGIYMGQDFLVDRLHNVGLSFELDYLDFANVVQMANPNSDYFQSAARNHRVC